MRYRPCFPLVSVLLIAPHVLFAQSARPPSVPASQKPAVLIEPGRKPPDAPAAWKRFVGIYKYSAPDTKYDETVIILERHQRSFVRHASGSEDQVQFDLKLHRMFILDPVKGSQEYEIHERDAAPYFSHLDESFTRIDAGSDPSHFYHIRLSKPIAELRATSLAAVPPEETGPFRQSDLVELVTFDPSLHLDIRYAQSNNFLSTPVYTQARAFMQRPAAQALVRVSAKLQLLGYGLLIHDAYRPWYVTKIFWDATPPEGKPFVADPKQGSKHNRGCAVDLTLYDLANGNPIEMPGLYDEMSPRSFPAFPGGTALERWHRDLLRRAMESEGFTVNEREWWHFDYRDWNDYQIMNVPFENLGQPQSSSQVP